MSMFDSFFNMGFKASKCKTLLKLTIPRIKLLRNKREHQIKQMRRDIAKLLETGQEATARVRVEHIIREENMMAAQELIELFCELISARLPIIETQRECPMDLKEAVSSLCFAAPRCADLPELLQVQLAFASKYGKEFIAAATQLMPACGVNRQLIELLSVSAPSAEKKLKLLKEIAEEHGLDWNPAAFESEIFKLHEDLLDGSTQFVIGSKAPLPEEKHEELLHSSTTEGENEQSSSDSGLDSLEFPKVPIAILRPSTDSSFTREEAPLPSAPSPQISHQISMGPEEGLLRVSDDETARPTEARQFVPFVYPPPSISEMTDPSSRSIPRDKNEMIEPPLQSLPAKSESNFDLEDVLFAAQAAAESAEHAASAARSAASLAHIRISKISGNQNSQSLDTSSDNPFAVDNHENSEFNNGSSGVPTSNANESLFKTSSFNEVVVEQVNPHHLPQRTTSMDDDPYSSYPNLFGSSSRSFT